MTETPGVTFGDLPKPGRSAARELHSLIAAQLRQRPGQWALIATRSSASTAGSTAHSIRTGKIKPYGPEGTYEAAARTVDGEHQVHARYMGEDKPGE